MPSLKIVFQSMKYTFVPLVILKIVLTHEQALLKYTLCPRTRLINVTSPYLQIVNSRQDLNNLNSNTFTMTTKKEN